VNGERETIPFTVLLFRPVPVTQATSGIVLRSVDYHMAPTCEDVR
jgi:hypothetical protein